MICLLLRTALSKGGQLCLKKSGKTNEQKEEERKTEDKMV